MYNALFYDDGVIITSIICDLPKLPINHYYLIIVQLVCYEIYVSLANIILFESTTFPIFTIIYNLLLTELMITEN